MPDPIQILVHAVPDDLKRAIAARVAETDSNMNDVLVGLLAARFDVAFEPTGRRSGEIGDSENIILRISPTLRKRLKMAAASAGEPVRDVIVRMLSEEFGTPFVRAPRRRRRAA